MMDEKKKVDTHSGKSTQPEKRSILQRLAGCFLCVCLVVVSMPLEYCIWPTLSAKAEDEVEETIDFIQLADNGSEAMAVGNPVPGDSQSGTEGSEAGVGQANPTDPESGASLEGTGDNQEGTPKGEGEAAGTDVKTDENDGTDKNGETNVNGETDKNGQSDDSAASGTESSDTKEEGQTKEPNKNGEAGGTDQETDETDQETGETDETDKETGETGQKPGEADKENDATDQEAGEATKDPTKEPSKEEAGNQPGASEEANKNSEGESNEGEAAPGEGDQPGENQQDAPADNVKPEDKADNPVLPEEPEGESGNPVEELVFQIASALSAAQAAVNDNFFSGAEGNYGEAPADGKLPQLEEIKDWEPVGWVTDTHATNIGNVYTPQVDDIDPNKTYYGLYSKKVTVTYYINGQKVECTGVSYLNIHGSTSNGNYDNKVIYDTNGLKGVNLDVEGSTLIGWSKDKDGKNIDYKGQEFPKNIQADKDVELYPVYGKNVSLDFYSGENQANQVDSCVRGEVNAPPLEAKDGWEAVGWSTTLDGSGEIINAGDPITVTGKTTYYGKYKEKKPITLTFDATEGQDAPEMIEKERLVIVGSDAGRTQYIEPEFDLTKRPSSPAGYSFWRWYTVDKNGNKAYYEGESAVFKEDTTLYAEWVDDIAPELGDATFDEGYYSIFDWFIGKKGLTITVPVTEEGEGVKSAQYILIPESGDPIEYDAKYIEELFESQGTNVRVLRQGQRTVIQFTIDENFKGIVKLRCIDNAGNGNEDIKDLKIVGGVIVEDHAPGISFSADSTTIYTDSATVNVNVEDALEDMISGGLRAISYQVDDGDWVEFSEDIFKSEIRERYPFKVNITGEGEHILRISAVDNAGNRSEKSLRITIQKSPEEKPGTGEEDNPGGGNSGSGNEGNGGNSGSGNEGNGGNSGSGNEGNGGNSGSGNEGNGGNSGSGNEGNGGNSGSGNEGNGGNSGTGNEGNGGNTNTGNNGGIFDLLLRPGNFGGGGTGNSGSTGGIGFGNIGGNIVKNTGSGPDITQTEPGKPQTGEYTHLEIYATLGMIAGFSYLLLYFQNGEHGMTEEKKDALISRLTRWAARGGAVRKGVACVGLFLLLAYYHSIGQCKEWADSLKEMAGF